MRRKTAVCLAATCLIVLPGCTWDSLQRGILKSLYASFGEGYIGDRFSDFDERYEQQSVAAAEYYEQR